jgi:hypothetical protein
VLGTARRGKNANADLPRLTASGGRHSGLGIDFPLGAGVPGGDVEDRQQVHLAAVGADGAAHGLAVRGRLGQQPGRGRPGFRGAPLLPLMRGDLRQRAGGHAVQGVQVAVHGCVERLRVDPGEDP